MKLLLPVVIACLMLLLMLLKSGQAEKNQVTNSCFSQIQAVCRNNDKTAFKHLSYCGAALGLLDDQKERSWASVADVINSQLAASWNYLLLTNKFNPWNRNRPKFQRFLQKLAEETWSDGLKLIDHSVERGIPIRLQLVTPLEGSRTDLKGKGRNQTTSLYVSEVESLAWVLDNEQQLISQTLNAIVEANRNKDMELSAFLAGDMTVERRVRIKLLANHVNALFAALFEDKSGSMTRNLDSKLVNSLFEMQVI